MGWDGLCIRLGLSIMNWVCNGEQDGWWMFTSRPVEMMEFSKLVELGSAHS